MFKSIRPISPCFEPDLPTFPTLWDCEPCTAQSYESQKEVAFRSPLDIPTMLSWRPIESTTVDAARHPHSGQMSSYLNLLQLRSFTNDKYNYKWF